MVTVAKSRFYFIFKISSLSLSIAFAATSTNKSNNSAVSRCDESKYIRRRMDGSDEWAMVFLRKVEHGHVEGIKL